MNRKTTVFESEHKKSGRLGPPDSRERLSRHGQFLYEQPFCLKLLAQNQREAVLAVANHYDFGVGTLRQILGGLNALPL